ncbi:MAG: MOSC domain-containing protein [Acidimicrobiaceae bacterium]|nr:MOSC domain-containing protein [Acidimicrobiaceae bacterium]
MTSSPPAATDGVEQPAGRIPSLLSVNVGMPQEVGWEGRTVFTGVFKHPVQGARMVRRLNIDGDSQGDLAGHGGEQRAVLVYQIQSYRYWEQHFDRSDFSYGQFGENLTVDGLADAEVCIGDRYQIGEAEFEVTQPRVTCFRVGMRLGQPELPALLVSHHRPGFYMRVIREGHVQAGDQIVKTRTGRGAMSVADIDALLYLPGHDPAKLRVAAQIPALSPGWQQSFEELLADAEIGNRDRETREAGEPAWIGFRALRVTKLVHETPTVVSVYLAAPDGTALPSARAGQYLAIRITGAGQPPPVRSYSLSSGPGTDNYRISVKREPHGAASTYLNTKLEPGATVEVAAARGEFVLDTGGSPVLLISAGIGVTPVLAMLHQLAAERSKRETWWIHGARRPLEHVLAAEAHALLVTLPNMHEHVFYSAATPDERRRAHARAGRLTKEELSHLNIPTDATAYICGPEAFMTDLEDALTALGIAPSRIHTELFGGLASINPGLINQPRRSPHQPVGPPGTGPLVTFSRSGISTPFDRKHKSVLELADACDISTRWSCRTGVCHTCTTALLSGTVSYQPAPLELPTEGEVLICCARPDTDIIVDM